MQKIRKGDKVVMLAGKDKGRTGEVLQVLPKEDRAVVRGVNVVKRHQRQTQTQEAGIISKEASVHLSNIAIVDKDAAGAAAVASEINAAGGRAVAITADAAREADIRTAVAEAEASLGVIRVLVNNVGIGERRRMLDIPIEDWRNVIDINLTATFLFTQLVARRLVDEGLGGSIVSIASVAGETGILNRSSYVASKHGIVGLTKTLALELACHNIRVNAVSPGMVATNLTAKLLSDPARVARTNAAHPMNRVAQPNEIADAVIFLASSRSSFTTGTVLAVDGGFLAGKDS